MLHSNENEEVTEVEEEMSAEEGTEEPKDNDNYVEDEEENEESEGSNDEEEEEEEEEENFSNNESESDQKTFEVKDNKILKQFKLSHNDIHWKLMEECEKYSMEKGIADAWDVYPTEVYDDYFIMVDVWNEKYFKLSYDKDDKDDKVYIKDESHVEVFPQYLTSEEKGALEMMRENFSKLEEENESLKKFKSEATQAYHEEKASDIFESFGELTIDDYKSIKENVHNYTLEEIEDKMFSILGRKKANFTAKPKDTKNKLALSTEGTDKPKNGYDHLFEKHGIEK